MDDLDREIMRDDAYLDRLLRRTLVRFHPSFRFEEAVAARLRAEASGDGSAARGRLILFPRPAADAAEPGGLDVERRGLSLLVGGAIASGVSLASIAGVIVWRRARTSAGVHVAEHVI